MNLHRVVRILFVSVAGMLALLSGGGSRALAQAWNPNRNEGVEILTRGPVHEAFAGPVNYDPIQGDVVIREPPRAIEEIPPEEMPGGDNVAWISGYWSWDDDRGDFIWISGIWRDPPPDRSWVPGYWSAASRGWTWTPGFWTATGSREVQYLPQPPDSLELGPSSPAPAANRLWVPGSWIWNKPWMWSRGGYAWRPGYWAMASPNWIWQPAHYVWTRRGYVFVEGYWDRTLERRGILFAPMYPQYSVRTRRDYVYSPNIVIQIGFLTLSLFDSPKSHHYYFGDYYGDEYLQRGFRPWFEQDRRHRGYDPIFVHQRWSHKQKDDQWEYRLREDYDYRRQNVASRPARTYSTQDEAAVRTLERDRSKPQVIAVPMRELSNRQETPIRFENVDSEKRQTLRSTTKELDQFRNDRAERETRNERVVENVSPVKGRSGNLPEPRKLPERDDTRKPTKEETKQPEQDMKRPELQPREAPRSVRSEPEKPERVRVPQSPVVGKHSGASGEGGNPPGRPDEPKPDRNIRSVPEDNVNREQPSRQTGGLR